MTNIIITLSYEEISNLIHQKFTEIGQNFTRIFGTELTIVTKLEELKAIREKRIMEKLQKTNNGKIIIAKLKIMEKRIENALYLFRVMLTKLHVLRSNGGKITTINKEIKELKVWKKAVTQIFFTYGLALGALVALGSYNPYHNNIVKQAFSICCIDSGTSIFAGFVVFSFIGYMAKLQGRDIRNVARAGPGLLFVAYPSGIMTLEGSTFWTVLFFFMVILIGIDSQFCTMEGFFTAIIDEWPQYLRRKYAREIFIAIACLVSYLIGLSMVTEGGMWVFVLFEEYGASGWCLLWLLFFECIAISWLYGVEKWYAHLEDMIGYRPSIFWKFCWVIACPLCCAGVFVFSLVDYSGAAYDKTNLPPWADGVGWLMALSSMICVPAYAIWLWIRTPGTLRQKYKKIICPDIDINELREESKTGQHIVHIVDKPAGGSSSV